jgi:hypothetical protein
MRRKPFLGALLALVLSVPAVAAAEKSTNAILAEHIKQAVVAKMPREHEDLSQWGKTIPLPPRVRFPRLRRTVINVNGRPSVPNGTWKRTKVWVNDPNRDLVLRVPEFRKVGKDTYRLRVETTVALQGTRERREWVNGISLLDVTADADAVVQIGLDVDVTVAFDLSKPLDGVKINARVAQARLDLRDFHLRRVGPVVILEQGQLGEELKAILQAQLKAQEPRVKEEANRAIAVGLKDGKGLLPALMAPGK